MTERTAERVVLAWCPDWSLQAIAGMGLSGPVAIIGKGIVLACSAHALDEGVMPGLRVRQAQHRCPELVLVPDDQERDLLAFEPVMRAIEEAIPHVQLVRPGVAVARVRGARRFYGSEEAVLQIVLAQVGAHAADVRVVIADGIFAAEQAARQTQADAPTRIVEPAGSAAFLAPLPIDLLGEATRDSRMATRLRRMGIHTIGMLTMLTHTQLYTRFGKAGSQAYRLACGEDPGILSPRTMATPLDAVVSFEPALADAGQVLAACAEPIHAFAGRLADLGLTCHEIQVQIQVDDGTCHERVWRHPWGFAADELCDRLDWQLGELADAFTDDADDWRSVDSCHHHEASRREIVTVRLHPTQVTKAGRQGTGLWGERPDEQVLELVSRLQRQLGRDAVQACALSGGRLLLERQVRRPWGDAPPDARAHRVDQPWPGSLPGPSPATVFTRTQRVQVLDADQLPVQVDSRGGLSGEPAWLCWTDGRHQVRSWAGPWPLHQRWWRRTAAMNRFQLVVDPQQAWVVAAVGEHWWAEARYD